MEHISQVLAKSRQSTPDQKNYYSEDEAVPERNELLEQLTRFNISSLNHTFEAFKVSQETQIAVKLLKALSEGKSRKKFILLYGTTGCGKTHLIEATIIAWGKRNMFSRYYTFSDIARSLKTALRKGADFYDDLFNRYCITERLIVDDIGMGTTESRFEISDLEDIIDNRYRKRYYPNSNLITILASNKDIKEIPDRVVSRCYDPEFGAVVYMGDKDYRKSKRE